MFDQLFTSVRAVERYTSAPLVEVPFVTSLKTWSQSWDVVVEPVAPRTPVVALPSSSKVLRRLGTSRISRPSKRGRNLARVLAGARLARGRLG